MNDTSTQEAQASTPSLGERLRAPFPSNQVYWRVQGGRASGTGRAVAYIDARCVQNRLDDVVGPENWEVSFTELLGQEKAVVAELRLFINGRWIAKHDVSPMDDYSASTQSNAREIAIKGVTSDAFKRAAVMWGIGRYLYDLGESPVRLDEYKRIVGNLPQLPDWALPPEEALARKKGGAGQAKPAPAQAPAPENAAASAGGSGPTASAPAAEQASAAPTGNSELDARWLAQVEKSRASPGVKAALAAFITEGRAAAKYSPQAVAKARTLLGL